MPAVHERDDEEIDGVTSDARPRARQDDDAPASPSTERTGATTSAIEDVAEAGAEPGADAAAAREDRARRGRRRVTLPLVPLLAILLALLIAAGGWLWLTRPDRSSVTTADYEEVLQAARSNIVDYTSFDYLTLDDDLEQIRRVAIGELRDSSVARLEDGREAIADSQLVVNSEVVAAGATAADADRATVVLVVKSSTKSLASPQTQVSFARIEVGLEKQDGRWLLSRLVGTDT